MPTRMNVKPDGAKAFQAWLRGEILLVGLLGAALAFFVAYPELHESSAQPELRLVLQTVVMLAAAIVAVLAGLRFSVERRRSDLLLSTGFSVTATATLAFSIGPALGDGSGGRAAAWAGVAGLLLAWALIAAAPFVRGRTSTRERALGHALGAAAFLLLGTWIGARSLGTALPLVVPDGSDQPPALLTLSFAAQALLNVVALVGFADRYRSATQDLDRWLALGATLMLFSSLFYVFTPLLAADRVSHGDFLRILGFGVLLVGVWRAIREAEFGRAVADERARVAREIHDGLAQYLFAVSTHASMLEAGAPPEQTIPRLKQAAALAQQEARFAVLALSSASGTAPFDAALRRYVEFLTADGELDVELELDRGVLLAPDEQIEVFRIVQEGLANVRKHAGARRAEVTLGEREGRRVVSVRDDGSGFEAVDPGAGQGLKNIRARAASIQGAFRVSSTPGFGTALEITLRA
jgi:signal transduction histidine kinase